MNDQLLIDAQAACAALDQSYQEADPADQLELKQARDAAFEALSVARRKLVAIQITVTVEDQSAMKQIRVEIEGAAAKQTLLVGTAKLLAALAKHAATV